MAAAISSYELTRCPACDAAECRAVAEPDDVRREMEALWAYHGRRLRPETPPERLVDRVAFSQRPPLRLVQCASCGLVYRNPRERARELRAAYTGEAMRRDVLESLFRNQRASYRAQVRRLTDVARRAGSVLEVGSYVGGFLDAARAAGWHATGVDVNETVNRFAREKGFQVRTGELDAMPREPCVDAVAFWNCFDQLPDPRAAARAARAHLRPGGVLAVRVPNGAFYARVRALLDGPAAPLARELLAQNNLLSFPYRHGFSARSLEVLLAHAGFRVERTHGDTLVRTADEWTHRWARMEERVVKRVMRLLCRAARGAPWIEVYGRVERAG